MRMCRNVRWDVVLIGLAVGVAALPSCRRPGEGAGDVPVPRGEENPTVGESEPAVPAPRPVPDGTPEEAPANPDSGRVETVDVATLPPPEVVWRREVMDTTPIRVDTPEGPGVLVFEADETAMLVDGRSGEVRWRRSPTEGDRWYGAAFSGGALLVHGGNASDRMMVQRLDATTGEPAWRIVLEDAFNVEPARLGGPGFALESYPRCRVRTIDPETGRLLGPAFEAPVYHMHAREVGLGGMRCGLHDVGVLAVVDGVAVVSRRSAQEPGLAGYGRGNAPVWSLDVPGYLLLGEVLIEGTEAVVAWTDGHHEHRTSAVARIDLTTGREVWRRSFDAGAAEDGGPPPGRIREVPGPAGHSRAILLPDPGHPRALDAATGETLWESDLDGVVLVSGETSDMMVLGNPGPDELVWFSPDGTVRATTPIASPIHSVVAFAGGAAVLGGELDSLDLITTMGERRYLAVQPGNAFPVDDGLAVIAGDVVLLIEPDGRIARYDPGTPWILARQEDPAGAIWVVMRRTPPELVGVRHLRAIR